MPRLIDLTHTIVDKMPPYPGDTMPLLEPAATMPADDYNTTRVVLSTHTGTHLDAPYHFLADGKRVDEMPLAAFYGPAFLVDLAPGGALEKGAWITTEMLEPHAAVFEPGARVVYRTGWGRMFGGEAFYSGYPSLTAEAARWIAERRIALLGMDVPSVSEDYLPTHHALLGAEIVIVESLANLEQLPPRFTLCCFPLKLAGRDGSPVRAVAVAG